MLNMEEDWVEMRDPGSVATNPDAVSTKVPFDEGDMEYTPGAGEQA